MGSFMVGVLVVLARSEEFWLAPMLITMALFGALVLGTQGTAIAPCHLYPVLTGRGAGCAFSGSPPFIMTALRRWSRTGILLPRRRKSALPAKSRMRAIRKMPFVIVSTRVA